MKYTYFVYFNNELKIFQSNLKLGTEFKDWLSGICGCEVEAAYCEKIGIQLPFAKVIPTGKTFQDFVDIVAKFLKRPLTLCNESCKQETDLVVVLKTKNKIKVSLISNNWLSILGALNIDVVYHAEMYTFGDVEFMRAWVEFYKGAEFFSEEEIFPLLEVLRQHGRFVIPGITQEIERLKPLVQSETGTLLQRIVASYERNPKELFELKVVQTLLLKQWLSTAVFETAPRTSDLTAAFNLVQRSGSALLEIGTLLQWIGFTKKRSSIGVIWPELADSAKKTAILDAFQPLRETDLFLGGAGLFCGL